jgi:hypothetical protein
MAEGDSIVGEATDIPIVCDCWHDPFAAFVRPRGIRTGDEKTRDELTIVSRCYLNSEGCNHFGR